MQTSLILRMVPLRTVLEAKDQNTVHALILAIEAEDQTGNPACLYSIL